MKKLRWTVEQEATFLPDYTKYFQGRLGIRTLRERYGKRSKNAFSVKAWRLGFRPGTQVETETTTKKVPNAYLGVERRLRARGFTDTDIRDIIFGPRIKVRIPTKAINEIENLLNLNGKTDIRFTVKDNKVGTILI